LAMALSKQLQRIHEAIMTIKQYGGVFGRNPTFNNVTIEGTLTFDGDIDIDSDLTISGDLYLPDNSKAIFGDGSDLQIYSDGSKSIIKESGAESLVFQATNINFKDATDTDFTARFITGGDVQLYYDGSEKLATTASGISVTGSVTADGLTVDGLATISSISPALLLTETDTTDKNTYLNTGGGTFNIQTVDDAGTGYTKRLSMSNATGDISFYSSDGLSQALFWDASASALGLGTTTPSTQLHVLKAGSDANVTIESTGTGSDARLNLYANSTGVSQIRFGDEADTNTGLLTYDHSNNSMQFRVDDSERMRIDSSGNLLVGTTSAGIGDAGIELRADGQITGTRDGDYAALLNRLTSDGDIINFRKDGTTVGSIGTKNSDLYMGTTNGADECYIRFAYNGDRLVPASAVGGTNDAALDLGDPDSRFKDLYLSGGVVFGTTGGSVSSKTLDDYEEGTFTPEIADAVTGGNTATGSTVEGHYTKVGRLVTLNMSLINIDTTGMTGGLDLFIRALPFTSAGGQTGRGEGSVRADQLTYSGYVTPGIEISDAYLRLADNVSAISDAWLNVSAINSGNTDVFISISYNVA